MLFGRQKERLVGVLKVIFEKYTIQEVNVFFNFYTFLLLELYDYETHAGKLLILALARIVYALWKGSSLSRRTL